MLSKRNQEDLYSTVLYKHCPHLSFSLEVHISM